MKKVDDTIGTRDVKISIHKRKVFEKKERTEQKREKMKFVVEKQTNWEKIHYVSLFSRFFLINRYIEKNVPSTVKRL